MQAGEIKIGRHFTWEPVDGGEVTEAIVTGVRTDTEEGLSSEVAAYAALWIEARSASAGDSAPPSFTIMVGTDGKNYLDGKQVLIQITS